MTPSISNNNKRVWLLQEKTTIKGETYFIPSKVFPTKELCFANYPEGWRPKEDDVYYLDVESAMEENLVVEGFLLSPVEFCDENDVKT